MKYVFLLNVAKQKKGLEVTTSPVGRIKSTLRSSTSRNPVPSANAPHTFHRKFVNSNVKCSLCKGHLKKQCYLCQGNLSTNHSSEINVLSVCRCCIHPRCFKDTPSNCYTRDDFSSDDAVRNQAICFLEFVSFQ